MAMALWVIACFAFFQFWYPYHFFFQEQNQIFLWSWDYISTYFEKPGGIARLTGDFLAPRRTSSARSPTLRVERTRYSFWGA